MAITRHEVEEILALDWEELPGLYSSKDTQLYAISIGMGRDPLDSKELSYVCETVGSNVMPTAASVLGTPSIRARRNAMAQLMKKMNLIMMLHGEQRLEIHQPLPSNAKTLLSSGVTGVYDKGKNKGALVTFATKARLDDGSELFTSSSTLFFRADGGFGGTSEGAPVAHELPRRAPDAVCEMPGRNDQALIYALNGDRNPLHRDPTVAKKAGFDKPILHGLCSYGIACHAVLKTLLDYDQQSIKGFDVRFSAPAFPGETQVVEMWRDGNLISFRSTLKERNTVCIDNGRCLLA
ncbi:MaoC/PaaZ C-terminal domain-containing protein [Haliea sp. E1-2-M8]|uniref:MaoC/PaaZ C-terminal domain-containing protein n=1 Tax=Haliea sp. E1-2-M8 TaxID=3064706 RepID=UPI0027223586|nr:MaoC/PaaZ C-terminal domain-containing protein [Haliea sp. E1-2-M8]MDO8864017.1 MaoC/PaaZ C-terminal domain-containing protein [Haliea sp. E1-2-M8]